MSLEAKLMNSRPKSLTRITSKCRSKFPLPATFLTKCFRYYFRPMTEKDDFHVYPYV